AGVRRDREIDRVALALLGGRRIIKNKAPDELALVDERERARRRRHVLRDVRVELLHEVHRLRLVLVEAEDLRGDEDVPTAGLHRIRQDELALPRRVEQVVPGRGLLVPELLREAVVVRDEAEDARVPAGPKARGL